MSGLLTVEQAGERIRAAVADFGVEDVPIDEAAGRILRQPVSAERDLPPFDRVMMDGIALRHASWAAGERRFASEGIAAAGSERMTLRSAAGCIEVMTGAVMPEGCDCVIPVERIEMRDGHARVEADYVAESGQFIHRRGSDHPEGHLLMAPRWL